ncbi:ABC transporter permease [Brevundimonas terrae]|uniref:ABC transporter permease n=1 Tax=Brevundimonas terrae TaxID=363631 RepID=A0ABP3I527_9CAUL|nr:ABC transporter permease [Brevundimonas terrae]NIJ27962.1 peptide/nickel transport system permease protein [Brevundimonas terrae]
MTFAAPKRMRAIGPRSLKIGLGLSVFIILVTLLALVWTPFDPLFQNPDARLMAPDSQHLFGTDALGRDVLSLVMAGAANSVAVAGSAVIFGLAIGVPLGLWAAARSGWRDDVVMRGGDLVFAFPSLLTAVMLAAATGPSAFNAALALGVFNIPVFMRVVRGAGRGLWSRDFVTAARAAGQSTRSISIRHILPHVLGLVVVQAAVQFAVGVAAEAGLSYLGLGAQPPAPSWGRMLAESQTLIGTAPWLAIFPGLAIFATVLALSLTGDGLRDRLDPRLKREV